MAPHDPCFNLSISKRAMQRVRLSSKSLPCVEENSQNGSNSKSNPILRVNVEPTRFVLWSRILQVYENANHIEHALEGDVIAFMIDKKGNELSPPRIPYFPGEVLNVVLKDATFHRQDSRAHVSSKPLACSSSHCNGSSSDHNSKKGQGRQRLFRWTQSLAGPSNPRGEIYHQSVLSVPIPSTQTGGQGRARFSLLPLPNFGSIEEDLRGSHPLETNGTFTSEKEEAPVSSRKSSEVTHRQYPNGLPSSARRRTLFISPRVANSSTISDQTTESVQGLRCSVYQARLSKDSVQAEFFERKLQKLLLALREETTKYAEAEKKTNLLLRTNAKLKEDFKYIKEQALSHLTSMEAVLTASFKLHEDPLPRLFIILPSGAHRLDTESIPLPNHFRIYFLCECGAHTIRAGVKEIDKVHLANHLGYDIEQPVEFFTRYGSYALAIMRAIQSGAKHPSISVPALAKSSLAQELKEIESDRRCQHPMADDFYTQENIKAMVARSILFLEDWTSEFDPYSTSDEMQVIEDGTLNQINKHLALTNWTRTIGNLCKSVTKEGEVKWICLNHFEQIRRRHQWSRLSNAIDSNGGPFDKYLGKVTLHLAAANMAKIFYEALKVAEGVHEVHISWDYNPAPKDIDEFATALSKSTVKTLGFQGMNLGPSIFDCLRRSPPLIQLFAKGHIHAAEIKGIPNFFERVEKLSNAQTLPNLTSLVIGKITKEGSLIFVDMIKKCTSLHKLTLTSPYEGVVTECIKGCPSLVKMEVHYDEIPIMRIVDANRGIVSVIEEIGRYKKTSTGRYKKTPTGRVLPGTQVDAPPLSIQSLEVMWVSGETISIFFSEVGLSHIVPRHLCDYDLQSLITFFGWAIDTLDLSNTFQFQPGENADNVALHQTGSVLKISDLLTSILGPDTYGESRLKSLRFNGLLLQEENSLVSIVDRSPRLAELDLVLGDLPLSKKFGPVEESNDPIARLGPSPPITPTYDEYKGRIEKNVPFFLKGLGSRLTKLELIGRTVVTCAIESMDSGQVKFLNLTEFRLRLTDGKKKREQGRLESEGRGEWSQNGDEVDLPQSLLDQQWGTLLNALDLSKLKHMGIYKCFLNLEQWQLLLACLITTTDKMKITTQQSLDETELDQQWSWMHAPLETLELVRTGLERTTGAKDGSMETQLRCHAPFAKLTLV